MGDTLMKYTVNPIDAALLLGMLFGIVHLSWLILVFLKFAQVTLDFIYWAHFIKPIFEVESFEIGRAITLLGLTVSVGAFMGYVLAKIFNTAVETNNK